MEQEQKANKPSGFVPTAKTKAAAASGPEPENAHPSHEITPETEVGIAPTEQKVAA
jgi:hypothetical protein